MNATGKLLPLFAITIVTQFLCCAATSDDASRPVAQSYYYDPSSPDRNEGYFANIKSHFIEIGVTVTDDEVRLLTATRHITSTPPCAEVYVGTRYMGRTNRGDLYFKPGQYVVNFRIQGVEWTEILTFVEGNNASLSVRKP